MRTCLLLEDEQFSNETVFASYQRRGREECVGLERRGEGRGVRDMRISLRARHLNRRKMFYGPMNQFTSYEVVRL